LQGERQTSYGALKRMVSHFAQLFAVSAREPRVVICAPQCAETYAAMFASLMAGGFYVPLNDKAGANRIKTALSEINPDVIVGDSATLEKLQGFSSDVTLINLNTVFDAYDVGIVQRPPHRLAYIMFTSGSTGTPKGAMISQDALNHYIDWAVDAMELHQDDRLSQHPNIGFDLSVLDIYGALCSGAALVPLNDPLDRLFPARAIRKHGITVWNSVPSVMGIMLTSGDLTAKNVSSLRLISFCGEPLLLQHLEGIFDVLPDIIVHNTYGPTEATVSCTLLRLTKQNFRHHAKSSMGFGEAIEGMSLTIEGGQDEGELLIAGVQLADGYWNDPDRTALSFFSKDDGGLSRRYYRSGDFVEKIEAGLFFKERRDHQVKIKGYRIELNEISSQIRRFGHLYAETIVDGQAIICFVEGEKDGQKHAALLDQLELSLEVYMQPQHILYIKTFPRNTNDKIDMAALRQIWNQMK
jgi:D-alanine--poly(phosphoribitol) ligase subunit 1